MKFTDAVKLLWDTTKWRRSTRALGFKVAVRDGLFFYEAMNGVTLRDMESGDVVYDPNPFTYVFIIWPLAARVVRLLNSQQ